LHKYDLLSWIDENPARNLESPKVQQRPIMPFTPDQMADILSAGEKYGSKARGGRYTGPENAPEATPRISETYFFWTGQSEIQRATGDWQRTLKAVFRLAGIPDGHAHRFRDTLAVDLLRAGVPMDRVSVVLGHSSIKVTEKHYSPWVRARQEQLEADVRRTWETPVNLRPNISPAVLAITN